MPAGKQDWSRSGRDRRTRDVGPPDGIERRNRDRRISDRRRGAERRRSTRRNDGAFGGVTEYGKQTYTLRPTHSRSRYAKLAQYGPINGPKPRTPKVLRAVLVTAVALACLLAGTLTESKAATAPKGKTGVVVKSSGAVHATLSYVKKGAASSGGPSYGSLKLTVKAAGRTTLRKLAITGRGSTGYLTRPQLTVREVTGDGIPDVLVDIYTGGAHCCSITTLVRSTPKGWNRSPITRDWADHSYRLADAGGSSTPEFITDDPRFTAAYTAYATSAQPIRIYSAEGGQLRDVTTQFPDWIRTDVKKWEQAWQGATQETDPQIVADIGRAAASAWIADLALLKDYDAAKAVYAAAQTRGDFAEVNGFGGQLGHDLKAWGYVSDPALVGLSDAPID
ncbi:MAG: hypothetical protein J7513_02625 [Solirubrobacteraceae bacterium]|nr:hypothetical protein [Solirubrobacteraceae bacterium]